MRPIYACLALTASSGVNFCCQPQFGRSSTRGLEGMQEKKMKGQLSGGQWPFSVRCYLKEIDGIKMKKKDWNNIVTSLLNYFSSQKE